MDNARINDTYGLAICATGQQALSLLFAKSFIALLMSHRLVNIDLVRTMHMNRILCCNVGW